MTLALTQDNGSPLTVTIPGSGPGTGTNSSFSFALAAGASVFLQTDGLGVGTSGAATITSTVPVGASLIFTVLDSQGRFQTEAGVGDSPVLTSLTLPVDISGSFDTGLALFNPGSSSATIAFKLLGANGVLVNSVSKSLAPKNHLATFVDNLFPGITNFRGSLAVFSTGGIAAATLRQYASGATYTTLPTASGAATGKAQVTPLLTATVAGINAIAGDPDISFGEHLLPGSLISGTISGAGQGIMVVASGGGNNIYSSQVNPLTGRYLIVVPDGTYSLSAYYQPSGAPNTMAVTVTYSDPNPVQVVFDAVRDIRLPSVTLFNASGSVSGLNNLPSGATTIVFTSLDNKVQGRFTLDASGNYQGVLPAGDYLACVGNGSSQIYNLGHLTVGGGPATGNYAIPATAMLSGTISGGGLPSIPSGTVVTATDTSAPRITQLACCTPPALSFATPDGSGQYRMVLAQNRSFAVSVGAPLGMGRSGIVSYPLTSSPVNLGGDTTLNFNIPSIVLRVQIFGNVNDGMGHVLADVVVTAFSQEITGAANAGFSTSVKTDIYGNYALLVPAGTNYQLTFVPPAPAP